MLNSVGMNSVNNVNIFNDNVVMNSIFIKYCQDEQWFMWMVRDFTQIFKC